MEDEEDPRLTFAVDVADGIRTTYGGKDAQLVASALLPNCEATLGRLTL